VSEQAAEIRPLQSADLPQVTILYCAVFNAPPWHDGWTGDTAGKRLADTLATPRSLGLLAWHRGRLAGALLGYREQWHDGGHFYIKELFVDPVVQRRGVGTRLLAHLTHLLTDQGVSRIYLLTEREGAAVAFYER
jgi:aminoglycoside 6'-N-acetyltransferase I